MTNHSHTEELNFSVIQLSRLLRMIRLMVNNLIRKKDINIPFDQLPVLLCIYAHGRICQQEIASVLLRDKSSVLRSVKCLHQKGYLHIAPDRHDARKRLLFLSPDGKDIAQQVIEFIPDFEMVWMELVTTKPINERQYAAQFYI